MSRIPVYFMPGLAASSAIFERINLSNDIFETILLEWEIPLEDESLTDYVKRISEKIIHPNPVLIGVSFGGIIVQELSQVIPVRKTIIISSVRSCNQFPRRMKITKAIRGYNLVPKNLVSKMESLARFSFSSKINQRLKLYEKFLSVRDDRYFSWAIRNVILWNRTEIDPNVIHIHGDADNVFPIKYITDCIVVKGGTHIMILNKFKWMNENLPKIILGQPLE